MRLLTKQSIKVIEDTMKNGEYIPKKECNFMKDGSYEEMFEHYEKETGIKIESAIWSWFKIDGELANNLDEIDTKLRAMNSYYENKNQNVVILLDIPDELVYLTDAYAWSSYLSDSDEDRELYPYNWQPELNWYEAPIDYIQAIFPSLKKEYIIDYKIIRS